MNLMGKLYTLVEGDPEEFSTTFPCSECALNGFLGPCEEFCFDAADRLGYFPLTSYFKRYGQDRP